MNNLGRLIRTLRFLKPIQWIYQIYFRIRHIRYGDIPPPPQTNAFQFPVFNSSTFAFSNPWNGTSVVYLNREKNFIDHIDWAFKDYGKLWQYNLQYFAHLPAVESSTLDQEVERLRSFYTALAQEHIELESYPVSLRLIHTIRLFSRHSIKEREHLTMIWRQAWFLRHRLEYHLLANHMLENAFALSLAGYVCRENEWMEKGFKLLKHQLDEQIFEDGGHYERSAMYHHILLWRLLETIDWMSTVPDLTLREEYKSFRKTASRMLSWMNAMLTPARGLSRWADMAEGIAPSADEIATYAKTLSLEPYAKTSLSASGYRVYHRQRIWLSVNVGGVSPSYQPAHAHADQLSFHLWVDGKEVVTDTGVSTYEVNEKRLWERGTDAHNTIHITGRDSAEIWGSFRMGRRPNVWINHEDEHGLSVSHNGYRYLGVHSVTRQFAVDENEIQFTDQVIGKSHSWEVLLHIHPDRSVKLGNGKIWIDGFVCIDPGFGVISTQNYDWCVAFNATRSATCIRIASNEQKLDWSITII